MIKRIILLCLLSSPVLAQTYAVPDNGNATNDCMTGYVCIQANTQQTISIGAMSFPPPWLAQATPAMLAQYGIMPVVNTPAPVGNFGTLTNSIQMINGVPTQVWATTPADPSVQTSATVAASNKALLISQAKSLAAQGKTAEALQILLQLQGN